MMSEKELLRVDQHITSSHNEYVKMRKDGNLTPDSGKTYFEYIRNFGWLQAVRAVLGKSNAELAEDMSIEERSWEK